MTPFEIRSARLHLGARRGKPVSQAEFARMCGLHGKDSGRLVRAWEAGSRRPGPERIETIKALLRQHGIEE